MQRSASNRCVTGKCQTKRFVFICVWKYMIRLAIKMEPRSEWTTQESSKHFFRFTSCLHFLEWNVFSLFLRVSRLHATFAQIHFMYCLLLTVWNKNEILIKAETSQQWSYVNELILLGGVDRWSSFFYRLLYTFE